MADRRVVEILFKAKDQASKSLGKINQSFAGMVSIGTVVANVVTKLFDELVKGVKKALTFLPDLVKEMARVGDEFDKMSHRTNLLSSTLSEWAFIMERAGGSAKDFETSVRKLSKSMYDFTRGSTTAIEAWERLGLSPVDAAGNLKSVDDILLELADALPGVTNDVERMAIAQELLGRGGLKMMVAMKDGSGAIKDQQELFKALNGEMSVEFTAAAAKFVDAQTDMKTAWTGLKADLSEPFMEAAAEALDEIALAVGKLGKMVDENKEEIELFVDLLFKLGKAGVKTSEFLVKINPKAQALMRDIAILNEVLGLFTQKQKEANEVLEEAPEKFDNTAKEVEDLIAGLDAATEILNRMTAGLKVMDLAKEFDVPLSELTIQSGELVMSPRAQKDVERDIIKAIQAAMKGAQEDPPDPMQFKVFDAPPPDGFETWDDFRAFRDEMMAPENAVIDIETPITPMSEEALMMIAEYNRELEYQGEIMQANQQYADQLRQGLTNVASQSFQAFLSGNAGALMFGRMIREVAIKAVSDLIAKLLIAKALKLATGLGFGQGGSVPNMAFGGSVPHAAYGYAVPDGPAGRDAVPIMAMPGEEVINRRLSQRMNSFLASQELATQYPATNLGGGGRGEIHLHMEVGRPVGRLDALDLGDSLVTAAGRVQEAEL